MRALGLELTRLGWRAVHLEARFTRTRVVGCAEGRHGGAVGDEIGRAHV